MTQFYQDLMAMDEGDMIGHPSNYYVSYHREPSGWTKFIVTNRSEKCIFIPLPQPAHVVDIEKVSHEVHMYLMNHSISTAVIPTKDVLQSIVQGMVNMGVIHNKTNGRFL